MSSPFLILLIGLCTVIGGILVLRLHAFLALVLGAFVVGMLTPSANVFESDLRGQRYSVITVLDGQTVVVKPKKGDDQYSGPFVGVKIGSADLDTAEVPLSVVERAEYPDAPKGHILRRDDGDLDTDLYIVRAEMCGAAHDLAGTPVIGRLTAAFGTTCGKIGLLIALASIIGYCLQVSGAAERIVTSMLAVTGERGAPLGFMLSGFVLGIPVFFDTVFYLMIPLGQALHRKTGANYLLYVLSIVAGATMAHSLVPPTPGPLLVAEMLGVETGHMIVGGCLVGLPTLLVGWLWATWISRRCTLPLRGDAALTDATEAEPSRTLPPLWVSVLPIVLPVLLIAAPLTMKMMKIPFDGTTGTVIQNLGDRNIALAIAAICALTLTIVRSTTGQTELRKAMEKAIASAGIIILITSAGGAFGTMLRTTGLDVAGLASGRTSGVTLVALAFLTTTVIRTAQGSATVAMITAGGVFGQIAGSGDLSFHPLYLALAIGCGSKPIAWMNDSGFWVITRMSGMTETEGLRYVTPMTTLMGLAGLILLLIAVSLFPSAGLPM